MEKPRVAEALNPLPSSDKLTERSRCQMKCPRNIFAGPLTWSMTSPCQGLLWLVLLCEGLLAMRALAWVRTPDEKGLRDRNSPMCTLSQNGYGDIGWPTKILPTLAAAPKSSIPLAVLSPPPQSLRGVTSDLDHPRTVGSLPSLATSNIEMNRITKLSPRTEIGNFACV